VQVGSYERALFLVHSECMHSNNAAHQPFRVNAVCSSNSSCADQEVITRLKHVGKLAKSRV
jgi:3-dehydroquinate synthase class II